MNFYVASVFALLVSGCSTSQQVPTAGELSYESVRFVASKGTNQNPSKFKKDITDCHNMAQPQYEADSKNSDKLAKIYGQPISPEAFAKKRKAQVINCMTGNLTGESTGKGWSLAKDS